MSVDARTDASANPAVVRVAATADIHFGRYPSDLYPTLFRQIRERADVLLICGDLTDHGDPSEARGLAREIGQHLTIPVVAVFGNHDCECGQLAEVAAILRDVGVVVLDGDAHEVGGVGFAGVKGFCGGFGPRALGSWGEPVIKQFVQEALSEALKLETALARLRATPRVALMHYAPVAATVEGEPPELFPFLGSSRLEEPLTRYGVAGVFHGHAHHGQRAGRLASGPPVFNVSFPLLHRMQPEQPFQIVECRGGAIELQEVRPKSSGSPVVEWPSVS